MPTIVSRSKLLQEVSAKLRPVQRRHIKILGFEPIERWPSKQRMGKTSFLVFVRHAHKIKPILHAGGEIPYSITITFTSETRWHRQLHFVSNGHLRSLGQSLDLRSQRRNLIYHGIPCCLVNLQTAHCSRRIEQQLADPRITSRNHTRAKTNDDKKLQTKKLFPTSPVCLKTLNRAYYGSRKVYSGRWCSGCVWMGTELTGRYQHAHVRTY